MTVARSSASRSSNAKAVSASVRNASMASSRSRKLAVSSTRYTSSDTLLGRLASGRGCAPLLKPGDGGIGPAGAAGLDVGQAALGIVDQQQVDALTLQAVVAVQPVVVDQRDVALTVLVMFFSAPALAWSAGSDRWARAWVKGTTSLAEKPMAGSFAG